MKADIYVSIVSMMRPEPHLTTSIFSGSPEFLFRRPQDLIEDALRVGFAGVQAIPVRGLTGNEPKIKLFEEAWNPVWRLIQAWKHMPGRSGEPSKLQDWVVSPNPHECSRIERAMRQRGIAEIGHQFLQNSECSLVEVGPKLKLTPEQIAEHCRKWRDKLVIDTSHIREDESSPLGRNVEEWKRTIDLLAEFTQVIHVNPGDDPKENEQFIRNPLSTVTGGLFAHALSRFTAVTIVAEHRPVLKLGSAGLDRAKGMLEAINKVIEVVSG